MAQRRAIQLPLPLSGSIIPWRSALAVAVIKASASAVGRVKDMGLPLEVADCEAEVVIRHHEFIRLPVDEDMITALAAPDFHMTLRVVLLELLQVLLNQVHFISPLQ